MVEEEFYRKLRKDQYKVIDEGQTERFSSIYKHLLTENKSELAREVQILLRNQYIKKALINKIGQLMQDDPEMEPTMKETIQIEKRRQIGNEFKEAIEQQDKKQSKDSQKKIIEVLINNQKEQGGSTPNLIKNRQVKGTNFNQESFNTINLEQIGLQKNLHELIKKFFTLSKQWDKDIDKDDKRIF